MQYYSPVPSVPPTHRVARTRALCTRPKPPSLIPGAPSRAHDLLLLPDGRGGLSQGHGGLPKVHGGLDFLFFARSGTLRSMLAQPLRNPEPTSRFIMVRISCSLDAWTSAQAFCPATHTLGLQPRVSAGFEP